MCVDETVLLLTEKESIFEKLKSLSDEKYKRFHSRIMPKESIVLGVRVPILHALSKKLAACKDLNALDKYCRSVEGKSYEEILLRGLVIARISCKEEKRRELLFTYLPTLESWASCDFLVQAMKCVNKDRTGYEKWLLLLLGEKDPYTIRFTVVMSFWYKLNLNGNYPCGLLKTYKALQFDESCVTSAVAWGLSFLMSDENAAQETFQSLSDDTFALAIRKLAIQKSIEARRVPIEIKCELRKIRESLRFL